MLSLPNCYEWVVIKYGIITIIVCIVSIVCRVYVQMCQMRVLQTDENGTTSYRPVIKLLVTAISKFLETVVHRVLTMLLYGVYVQIYHWRVMQTKEIIPDYLLQLFNNYLLQAQDSFLQQLQ